jgi:hypothetical protein
MVSVNVSEDTQGSGRPNVMKKKKKGRSGKYCKCAGTVAFAMGVRSGVTERERV